MSIINNTSSTTATQPDFEAIKAKQRIAWGSGDYSVVGVTLQIVGESLCEALDLRSGQRVLDVAAGNGNVSLAAARRFCQVTSTDYVQELLNRGMERAHADRLPIEFQTEDAENLSFEENTFDAVTSSFGVMFTPNQDKAAAELIRVCKPGGKVGLANWTPDGFIGQLFKTIGSRIAPPAGLKSPALWGTPERLNEFFGVKSSTIEIAKRVYVWRYESPEHWLRIWKTIYGPLQKAFAALEPEKQDLLEKDLLDLIGRFNVAEDGTMVVPSDYLEVVVNKREL